MNAPSAQVINMAIKGVAAAQLLKYVTVAAYAIPVYEWFVCLSDEYTYVHKARWTSVKFAYFLCRYFPIFVWPVYIWAWVGNNPVAVCAKVVQPLYILVIFPAMLAQVVFIIRTYAFTGRNKFVLAFLFAIWGALLGAQLWKQLSRSIAVPEWQKLLGDFPCSARDQRGAVTGINAYIHPVMRLCTFLFDTLMMAMVVIRCFRFRSVWGPLGKAFVNQGLMAYVMLSALNLAATFVLFNPERKLHGICFLAPNLSCVIAARLILMLRRRADPTGTTEVRNQLQDLQDAIGQLPTVEKGITFDKEGDHQTIDRWA